MVWESAEGKHAEKWRVWPVNMGLCLSIDETALSRGELYTIISNRNAHKFKQNRYDIRKD